MDDEEKLLDNNETSLLDIDDADDLFIKPQKKHKVLMLSDHQLAPSGVGIQSRFLIQGLINTGKYSFRCLGGAIKHQNYNLIKVNDDFIIKPVDGFGTKELIRELLIQERPDALMLFTDPRQFIWLWEMEDEIHQICPIVYWHVWDNDPYPKFNSPWYDSCELINCLSKKTYDMVKPNYPEKTNYVPHAFPKNVYFPLAKEHINQLNQQNFGPRADWFKALWINRNAVRKMPADLLVSWKLFLDKLEKKYGHRNALLIMHTDPKDREGPDLLAVTNELQLNENVWFSTDKVDFPQMNILHNLCDTVINIAKNEGFGLCLSPDTLVKTKETEKQIKDIHIGDYVKSADGKYHKVLATSSRQENNLIEISFHGNPSIVSSCEHPFLVKDLKGITCWKRADELTTEDFLCYPKLNNNEEDKQENQIIDLLEWLGKKEEKIIEKADGILELKMGYSPNTNGMSIADIQKEFDVTKHYAECIRSVALGINTTRKHNPKAIKDLIKSYESKTGNKFKANDQKQHIGRFVGVDENFFDFMGWYLAEGSSFSGKGVELDFHSKEYPIAQKLQSYVQDAFNMNYSGVVEKYGNKSRFYCSSKMLSRFMENACGKYSLNKKLNGELFKMVASNTNYKKALLKALFHGDGHFSKNKRYCAYTTISSELAYQIRDLLLSTDIMCSLHRRTKSMLENHRQYVIKITGMSYEKFCNFIGVKYNENKWKNYQEKTNYQFDENWAYFSIKSIKRFKKERTLYDIQVDGTKNFIANGIVAHNSTLASLQCGKPVIALCTGGETSKVLDPETSFEYGAAIQPAVRTLVGSQLVPFIYEDIASHEDVANGCLKVFEMTPQQKAEMKEKAVQHVERNFNFDRMISDWDKTLDKCINEWKENGNKNQWSLTTLNPVINLSEVEENRTKSSPKKAVKKAASKKRKNTKS